jgi:phage baseplate assembly protein W
MAILQQSKIFVGYSTIETNSKQQQFADIPLIKRDLLNHFNTIPGQRVMMPTFGCSIWNLLFEPFDDAVRDAIVAECTKVINAETRVVLNNITVNEFNQGIIVQMELLYQPYNVLDSFSVEFDRRAVAMA